MLTEINPTTAQVSCSEKQNDITYINDWTQDFCAQVLSAAKVFKPIPGLNVIPYTGLEEYLECPRQYIVNVYQRNERVFNEDDMRKITRDQVIAAVAADKAQVSTSATGVMTGIQFSNGYNWALSSPGLRVFARGFIWGFTPRGIVKLAVLLIAISQVGVDIHEMIAEHKRYEQIIRQGLYDPLSKQYLTARAKGYIKSISRLEVSPIHIPSESLLAEQVLRVTRPSLPN